MNNQRLAFPSTAEEARKTLTGKRIRFYERRSSRTGVDFQITSVGNVPSPGGRYTIEFHSGPSTSGYAVYDDSSYQLVEEGSPLEDRTGES